METILVLDDDQANLQGIAGVLRFEQYSVLEASTSVQALKVASDCGLSLFISDMELSQSSGTETALRLVGFCPNLRVLFISGTPKMWWNSRDVANFKRFLPNSVDFIEKPFSLSQLVSRVKDMIGRTGTLTPKAPVLDGRSSNAA